MDVHIYRRNRLVVWGQLAFLAVFFSLVVVPAIMFITSADRDRYDSKMWPLVPVSVIFIWIFVVISKFMVMQTRRITIDNSRLTISNRVWLWEDIRECNLNTLRESGLPGKGRTSMQAAVLVFSEHEEVQIYFAFYKEKSKLVEHIENVVTAVNPGAIKRSPKVEFKHALICPRCQGKTYVTKKDIQRLGHGEAWTPGDCIRCGGVGFIEAGSIK